MRRYLVVVEKGESNYGAYIPDLPGCVALGDTVEETLALMKEALAAHLEGMVEDDDPIPEPTSIGEYVDVDLPEPAVRKSA